MIGVVLFSFKITPPTFKIVKTPPLLIFKNMLVGWWVDRQLGRLTDRQTDTLSFLTMQDKLQYEFK